MRAAPVSARRVRSGPGEAALQPVMSDAQMMEGTVASQRDTPKRLRHAEIDDVTPPPPSGKNSSARAAQRSG
jgi:hypothetical protein